MRSNPTHRPMELVRYTARELSAFGLRLVGYIGILALLVVAATMLWDQLPDAMAQARDIAVSAGWTADPPLLRGSL